MITDISFCGNSIKMPKCKTCARNLEIYDRAEVSKITKALSFFAPTIVNKSCSYFIHRRKQ